MTPSPAPGRPRRRGHAGVRAIGDPAAQVRAFQALEPFELHSERGGLLVVARRRHGFGQQVPGGFGPSLLEQIVARLEHFLRLAVTLGEGRAGAIDVGAGARVVAIEEEDARPDVNRFFVLSGEVPIQAVDEQRFSPAVAVGSLRGVRLEAFWIGHVSGPRGL